jgi:1-acyl-sn-glycerol-3-phosphate acyltransferase
MTLPHWTAILLPGAGLWLGLGWLGLVWLGWACLCDWVLGSPRAEQSGPKPRRPIPGQDWADVLIAGSILVLFRVYFRCFHRVRYEGLEHLRRAEGHVLDSSRPVIVIANHTAGIDPLLVQNMTRRFEPRWMMARDMRVPALEPLWRWSRIIDVERRDSDSVSAREALRHLAQGGVLGLFPEGGIERPPRRLLPFQPGIGLLIKRSGAVVLPVIIEGTPAVDPAFASLWHPSRPRVRYMPLQDYAGTPLKPAEIAADLQRRYLEWTGWPLNEHRTDGVGEEHRGAHEVPAQAEGQSRAKVAPVARL